ncbi:MAG: cobalamin-binding protein [Gemmatimonadetes bacterium]|nr:cobalamin-binding protein [Gemmatimonadota bacterium]
MPGATDIIVALGGAASLVGVSHTCDVSRAGVPDLPRVTTSRIDAQAASGAIDASVRASAAAGHALHALDRDAIERLGPDLIVTQALCEVCAVSEAEVRALAAQMTPSPTVLTLAGSTIEDILADIATLGGAIGLVSDADELTMGLRRRMRTVHEKLKAARAPRPRVAVIEWTDPLFNAGHWVPDQVRRGGGSDVLGEPGTHSHVVTASQLRAADPEIVIVAPCGFPMDRAFAEAERLVASDPWFETRNVWALDGNALTSRPGPALVEGIETMAHIFAPTLFPPCRRSVARQLPAS